VCLQTQRKREEKIAMEYTQLGRTDLRVSTIAYGTWQFGGD